MQTKKLGTESSWVDPDDAPALTKEWFDRAEIREGERLVRPARAVGRPKSAAPKEHINIRLSPRVLDYFKSTGPGWQSRIDAALVEWVDAHDHRP